MALKVLRPTKEGSQNKTKKADNAKKNQRANRTILQRTLVLMIGLGVVAFIPLIATLYDLMIVEHDYYEEMAIDNQTRYTQLAAARGLVYDRNMNILASSTTVETVFIDPNEIATKMEEPENSALLEEIVAGLSEILDVDPDFIRKQAADTAYRYKVIRRKVDENLADQVRAFINDNDISGVYLEADSKRAYPYASVAAQVLGFVSSDNVGAEGIEAYYNSRLEGTAGKVVTTKGNYGSEMLYTYEKYYDASNGDSLVLTLDTTVQQMLEKNLQAAIERYDIINGAFGIVMDVNTGEILGMATMGSYDPNNYQQIYDQERSAELEELYQRAISFGEDSEEYKTLIKQYNEEMSAARLKQWRNRCVSDGYEPGSTFKLVTLAAALDAGAVTLNDSFYCTGSEKFVDRDQEVSCWKRGGHGAQNTAQALENSCNPAFGHIGIRLGGEDYYAYADAFGLMEQTGIDLPGEASGYFFSEDQLTTGNAYLISGSFGQTFRVTPLQQIRAIAAIVNGGYLVEPYIVSQVVDSEGNVVEEHEPTILRQVISESTSATMRTLMEGVVTSGTAGGARTPGYRVGGKTGTSEKIDVYDEDGNPVEDKILSFVGVAPIDAPQYIVLVALDTPEYTPGTSYTPTGYYISGGLMAAPTVRDVFLDILPYLGVEPNYDGDDIRGINFTMPELIGMTKEEAAAALSKETLTFRSIGNGAVVTDQVPAAGAQLPGKSEVILYFGAERNTELVEVPDFVGYGVADVNWLANNAGVYVQAKGTDISENWVSVTYQDVEPGTMVERGATITVEFTDHGSLDN